MTGFHFLGNSKGKRIMVMFFSFFFSFFFC